MDKIQRKAEDKLVEELSEHLANKAVQPINNYMDSLFAESYEQQTGERYDPENSARMSETFTAFLGTAVVPETYTFNYSLEVEVKDFGAKKSDDMILLINTEEDVFGIEQYSGDDHMRIVFDNVNESVVSYNLDKKEMLAIPLNSSMMSSFVSMGMQNQEDKYGELRVEKLNKTKEIIGYESEGYRYTTDESKSDVYISDKLPFTWDESFGTMLRQFAANFYKENEEYNMDGMLMEARTTRLEDKKVSEWNTTKISDKKTTIDNSDYERTNYGG